MIKIGKSVMRILLIFYEVIFHFVRICHNIIEESVISPYFHNRYNTLIPTTEQKSLVVHCASYGEYEATKPILRSIKNHNNTIPIVLSFFSPSGYEFVADTELYDYKVYSPFESKKHVRLWLKQLKPRTILISQNEIWPIFLNEAIKSKIDIVFIGSYFSRNLKNALFLRLMKPLLQNVKMFFVQRNETAEILTSIGLTQNNLIPRLRDEEIGASLSKDFSLPKIERLSERKPLLILASIHDSDFHLFQNTIRHLSNEFSVLIAPHDVNTAQISAVTDNLNGLSFSLYSDDHIKKDSIVILNEFGILKYAYSYAKIIYVGGGFDKGIHNVSEAAYFKNPIIVGKKYRKFEDAVEYQKLGVLISVLDSESFLFAVHDIKSKPKMYYENLYSQLNFTKSKPSEIVMRYLIENQLI